MWALFNLYLDFTNPDFFGDVLFGSDCKSWFFAIRQTKDYQQIEFLTLHRCQQPWPSASLANTLTCVQQISGRFGSAPEVMLKSDHAWLTEQFMVHDDKCPTAVKQPNLSLIHLSIPNSWSLIPMAGWKDNGPFVAACHGCEKPRETCWKSGS